eukprot:superscaffoldBa00000768_g7110
MDEQSEGEHVLTGLDEEAIVDHGKTSFTPHTNYEKEDLESHRAVYVGVHVPLGRESKRRHRHRGHKHHRKKKERDTEEGKEDGRESPSYDMLIDSMVASGQLKEDLRDKVREAMLKKHHHQNERKLSNRIPLVRSIADIGKKHSDPLLLERNGEGLSSSRLSLQKPGAPSSVSNLSQRRESKVSILLNHLLPSSSSNTGPSPGPSPLATPQNTPASFRRSSQSPPRTHGAGPGPLGIPEVVVSPPEDDDPPNSAEEEAASQQFSRRASSASQGLELLPLEGKYLCSLPVGFVGYVSNHAPVHRSQLPSIHWGLLQGPLVSPNSVPNNLDGNKAMERRPSKAGVSRESSSVDFSKVDMNFMKKIPPGAEASNVLVGEVDFLEKPIIAFVRLSPAVLITGLTEVPVPTRIFGGLIADIKRKIPFYWSDIKDSFSLQCLASILFLYCACMSPVITFGGLLGEATKGNISAIESLFGASLTGVAYSLSAGQPLTILGSTGPVLVFEKILFKFCSDYSLSYLSLRTSIGLWTAFLCIILVATDASSLVCYITRFTEEAFAALICIIFIYEALEKLFHLGEHFPVNIHNNLDNLTLYSCQCSQPVNATDQIKQKWNETGYSPDSIPWSQLNVSMCKTLNGEFVGPACSNHGPYIPDVLFWSIILFFTTFFLSSFLKQFKTERYFPTKVRSTISDFAVFITIMIMVLVDYLMGIPSPKLNVPDRFEPTSKNRGWLIDPLGENPWWTLLVAALPALLCTILIFMDQQITAVIINRKEHKLKKGCGYHLDLLIVAIMLGICSIMGLPWFVAATVLSISHVNSLKVESGCSAPGEQPKFLGIREQRVTGFMIFVLMGCSVFMTSVLKFIPMPVLYGVFLYMGVSSLKGIQFFDRIKLFGMPAKHQPDLIYLRYVPLWKVHIFTLVQLTCLVVLWVIKASAAAVVFPMMVLALVFIRKLLDFFFTKRELSWLDDLMPESKKKKEDDKKKKARKELEEESRLQEEEQLGLKVSYEGSNRLSIPVKALSGSSDSDPLVVNISDEMAKSAAWKAVNSSADSCAQPVKRSGSQEKVACVRVDVSPDSPGGVSTAETFL